jgi:hypothetical protein
MFRTKIRINSYYFPKQQSIVLLKMAVFWNVSPCSLVELTNVSDVLTASIIRAMMIVLVMVAISISETSVNF